MNVRIIIKPCVLVLLLCVGQAVASEPDFARETRLSDEIVDVILDGDPVWLEAGGREFLSIIQRIIGRDLRKLDPPLRRCGRT